jgi:predicted DNA-binding transcriptional regulator YafY
MSRAARLLALIQALRRRRRPVTAAVLADELGVSERTVYRDIATLEAEGAPIAGEAGIGYVLKPGFMLPPLMFADEEIEALVLGLRFVVERGDRELAKAAQDARAKIAAVLPEELRERLDDAGLLAGPARPSAARDVDMAEIRRSIRGERKLRIRYRDGSERETERVIWPLALAFFEEVRVVVAWCELRGGFRHFRADRIGGLVPLAERLPRRRRALVKQWRETQGIPPE